MEILCLDILSAGLNSFRKNRDSRLIVAGLDALDCEPVLSDDRFDCTHDDVVLATFNFVSTSKKVAFAKRVAS